MSSPFRGPFGNSGSSDHSRDYSTEFNPNGSAPSTGAAATYRLPEPVTPPSSVHSNTSQSKSHYFSNSHLAQKSQYPTPTVNMREHSKPSVSYSSSSLASPIDTPRTSGSLGSSSSPSSYTFSSNQQQLHPPGSQQQYVATPHSPFSNAMMNVPSTPIGANGPIIWPMVNSTAAPSFQPNSTVGGGGTTAVAANPKTAAPYGHSRSYSYTTLDLQSNMSRMSISSTSSSGSQDGFRPRAYSLSIPAPVGTTPIGSTASGPNPSLSNAFGGSVNFANSTQAASLDGSSSSNPFPPPLSSPLSPEHVGTATPALAQRGSYPYTFLPSLGDDSKSLHSSLNPTGGLTSTSSAKQSEDLQHGNRRSSPPQVRYQGKSRRSSSSASSIDFGSQSGNAGIAISGFIGSVDAISGGGTSKSASSSSTNSAATSNSANSANSAPATNIDVLQSTDEQIHSLCRDQRGCRYLQRKLAEGDVDIIRRVFKATHIHIVALMMDPFGNYFCQKLFENCSPDDVTTLFKVSKPFLPTVAVNQHGTRALQKLIDAVSTQEQVDILVSALDGHVVHLIRDLNGNHVIQKLLLTLDERGSQFIYDAVCLSVVEIGSHRHGCCVLQRCLDYAEERNRRNLISHIVAQALVLVCDPFGNYVCQYVIDLGVQEYTDAMIYQLLGKICALSVQKFSSNVVEKCLRSASPQLQRTLLAEVMEPKTFHELLLDNYGNYVIQTALESTGSLDAATKRELASSIQTALMVTRSPYGRRIMSKLKSW